MPPKQLLPGLYEIPMGMVNVWLLESQDGLVLIDTGVPGSAATILEAVRELGKHPSDIRHILITHAHPDHIGSLAPLKKTTGAQVYIHPTDAEVARQGSDFVPADSEARSFTPAPSLIAKILYRLYMRPYPKVEGTPIDHEINEGHALPFLPDLKVLFTPGHSLGHLAYLWERDGGVLFAGDVCANIPVLSWSIGYEDIEKGKHSLKRLCGCEFEIATFGHGKPITKNAAARWRKRWGKL